MNRNEMIARIQDEKEWDVLIIGGGATGAGIAVDSASRGYKTLLLEKGDFGQGTSSRSTKLVHGGVRYLQQGNIALVLEALKERGILHKNAPHLVSNQPFIVPNYDWWEGPFYGIGLKLYDMLAGRAGFGKSQLISKEETLRRIPTLEQQDLNGGVLYYDGQFDDARLVINLLTTAVVQGAVATNYMGVTAFIHESGLIHSVTAYDRLQDKEYRIRAKVIINATGPFTDSVRRMDHPDAVSMVTPSQGVHLVLDQSFLPGNSAIMVPHTDDGRVLFAIPWHQKIIVGTTDTPLEQCDEEPRPLPEEVTFLLEHAARYLSKDPTEADVLSVFAGIRPLVSNPAAENTAAISREHVVNISKSGLVTIAGGKWTTYRKMAEDTLEKALVVAGLEHVPCITTDLQIHGYHQHPDSFNNLKWYGSDAVEIQNMIRQYPSLGQPLQPDHQIIAAEVVWAVREEMAMTVADFLSRRRRTLLLNARGAREVAPAVAEIMRHELNEDESWLTSQIDAFNDLVSNYMI